MTLYCDLCSLAFSGELKGSALFKRSRPHLGFTPFYICPLCPSWTGAISKPYQTHIWPIYGSPPFQILDFGLCARVSQRFDSTLSPRSNFPTGQRFLLPNHVTSGCLSPRSLLSTGQRFPLPKHVTSGCLSPRSLFSNWPAVS